ncbi:MAG TPA: enoyl-CoA hydratase-related protein [Quisquiliibacterium sp.]|nr:enoyl-CoA hydratase-related protein [Quisquiliibacterium sp.]
MQDEQIGYERRGPLAIIRLERPDALNAITYPMIAGIERRAREAEADPAVFAICITGAGRGFCAGIDMSVLSRHTQGEAPERARSADATRARPALFSFLLDVSKPVIAAVNGVGAGGGFVLAMMCDLRFMAEESSLITVFSKRGLIAEHGTSWLLPRMIGLGRALDLLWSSRKVDAAEAYRIGLADRVVSGDRLLDEVQSYVEEMAATVSPRALATIKAQVHRHLECGFEAAALESDALMTQALKHPDAAEGAKSFIERRPPRFAAWKGEQT